MLTLNEYKKLKKYFITKFNVAGIFLSITRLGVALALSGASLSDDEIYHWEKITKDRQLTNKIITVFNNSLWPSSKKIKMGRMEMGQGVELGDENMRLLDYKKTLKGRELS